MIRIYLTIGFTAVSLDLSWRCCCTVAPNVTYKGKKMHLKEHFYAVTSLQTVTQSGEMDIGGYLTRPTAPI